MSTSCPPALSGCPTNSLKRPAVVVVGVCDSELDSSGRMTEGAVRCESKPKPC
jgi:hypothetical protein